MYCARLVDESVEARDADDGLRDLLASYARGGSPETITVVGNAPMPPDAGRAALIDDSDLVIRMTTFTLDEPGAMKSYGRRTDVVVIHRGLVATPHTFADYTSRCYLLAEPGRMFWEPATLPDWWPADLGFVTIPNRRYVRPLQRLLGLDPAKPRWATTGTLMVYLCTELFPAAKVRLTGTSLLDRPDQTRFEHAWGDTVEVTAEHRLRAESGLLAQWCDDGRIEIVQ